MRKNFAIFRPSTRCSTSLRRASRAFRAPRRRRNPARPRCSTRGDSGGESRRGRQSQRASSARSPRWSGPRCAASSTPPASSSTPIWDARPSGPLAACRGYSNLEYDLAAGRRGKRDVHTASLLERLIGAPGIAVNNNAAAVFLALNELAAGGEAIVSRGELIEIGDGFRIPDIMARSGAILREVGTTNRTRIDDYRDAITDRTRLLLRVHPSNFRISGFTARPELRELAALGRERGIPVYEDLGSGCLVDLRAFGIDEPLVSESLAAGVDLVSFSGDKLLGGPQAGILAGRAELVARLRRNPLFRALRLDKLIYQALEDHAAQPAAGTLGRSPALAMIRRAAERDSRARAERCWRACPASRTEVVAGRIGDRRRRHAGAIDSHLADRRGLRQTWWTRNANCAPAIRR